MVSAFTDRFDGAQFGQAIKNPCAAVSNSNLTLSGEQTVSSVAVTAGDRVLVKDQTDATENGVYTCETGAWIRALDFDGQRDVVNGTVVTLGTALGELVQYQVTTANPIVIGTSEINFQIVSNPNIEYPVTAEETSAGVTPVNLAKFPSPIRDLSRYVSDNTGASDVYLEIKAAYDAAGATSSGSGEIIVPDGTYLFATGLTPPNVVQFQGESVIGAILKYTGSGVAVKFGTSDSALNFGCALRRIRVNIDHKAATAVLLNSTNGAILENLYITGENAAPFDNTRTNIGIDIDGRNISNFFNSIRDVNSVHVHTGYRLGTTGTTNATTTNFYNCQAYCDVPTDDSGIGVHIGAASSIAQGDGSKWDGGDIEGCATGLYMTQYAYPMSFIAPRFEANTVDILLDSGCPSQNFIGLTQFRMSKVIDNSGNPQNWIGCTQGSLVTYNNIPALLSTKPIENVTTTNVITPEESGTTFYLNSSGGFTSTLPAAAAGLHYTFIVRVPPSSGNYVITTDDGDNVLNGFYLDIVGELVSFNAMDTLNFVSGASLQSDRLELECDGNTWHCKAFSKADGGITVSVT